MERASERHQTVYTLGGQRLEATDVDVLPAGTYIACGKKVMKQ